MRVKQLAFSLLLFALIAAFAPSTDAQRPAGYFSLSTNKTYLPGEKIGITVFSENVDALEFRVYRVKDPVAFFEHLDNVHNFGHTSPKERVDNPTVLERVDHWKHATWVQIRDFFRTQFSRKSRAHIREDETSARSNKSISAAIYAQVPLLNSSQLVARWHQPLSPRFYSETATIPVDTLEKGAYLIEATNGDLRAYTIVMVSELGLVTKISKGQVLVFAADRRSGVPIPDADVRVWSNKQQNVEVTTDSSGLAQASLPADRYDDVRILALHGNDVAIVTPYSYNLSSNPGEDWQGYVYTDRPVYRPGDTAHFKAILRTIKGTRYEVPAGAQVDVLVEDSTSKPLFQKSMPVSSFGSIHADVALPANAALGYYSISVRSPGSTRYQANGGFHVEEYKKPEYEVKVTPSKSRVLQGDTIEATIEARYFFGEPVANANVKYVVHTSRYWSPFIVRDEDDEDGESEDYDASESEDYYAGQERSEQSGKLDANGKLTIQIPTDLDEHHFDLRYRIEARVTDEGNREISGHNYVLATYGSFQLGISTDTYVISTGDTIDVTIAAKDYDGSPIKTPVRVSMVRYRWEGREHTETTLGSQDSQTDDSGIAHVQIKPTESGGLTLKVTAQTPEGREVRSTTWVWISGADIEPWWTTGESRSIRIITDKKSYKPGDTAHIVVMTGIPETYLMVTTEARDIQSKQVVHATSNAPSIDIPIHIDNQPNVYVSVAFWQNNRFYESSKNLKVPAVQQKLQIDIQPSQKQFQPGQKVRYDLNVRDADGKPAIGEFSIGVVDEAIYSIYPDAATDIHGFFYADVYDHVTTDSSLNFYFSGEAGKKQMFLAYRAQNGSRALAQLKPEIPVQPKIRKVFPDTALWLADVRTDSHGHAETQFEFPDSLTTWRATVRGATLDTKVGNATNNVIVRKNLMVRMVVPRFFRQGDEVTVSAIVHNYLANGKNVQVSLDVQGLELLTAAAGQIEVPSKGEVKFHWQVRAKSVQKSVLTAKALTNEESDAMELTLPVIPFGVKQTTAQSGSLVAVDQEEKSQITLPDNFEQSAPSLDLNLTSSFAGGIFAGLDYLTSYPYGCTEQTMSSFLPNIVVAQALKDLHIPNNNVDTPELEKKIRAGMDRLKDFQHDDGGWGWWKEDESMVFMTAYVISGFAQANSAGYDVDTDSLRRAETWLHNQIALHPDMRNDLQSYAVYALALNSAASSGEIEAAWSRRGSMSVQGLAMLGLALQASGYSTRAQEIAKTVESDAAVSEQEVSWPSNYDYFLEFETNDAPETTAYAVKLISLEDPQSPLLPKAAFWLVNHRDGGYFWFSTKQTAMVIFGLTEYLKANHELEANFHAELFVNGKQIASEQFVSANSLNPAQPAFHLNSSELHPGVNEIRIHKSGAGRLYWSASASFYSNDKRLVQNNKLSLNITRDYFVLTPTHRDNKIVYHLDPLSGDLHVGDVLAVRMTVAGSEWRYLLMEDPIPAGAEFITRDDLYDLDTRPPWWEYWFTRREFHDDRAAIFQEYFRGQHQYVYLLKIVNPGKFQVSPAMVQPMYQPSVVATSDAAVMEVK